MTFSFYNGFERLVGYSAMGDWKWLLVESVAVFAFLLGLGLGMLAVLTAVSRSHESRLPD